jgi:hypothetical protein
MVTVPSVELSDIILSVARSVVEANRILNEGSDTPMGITEFRIKYQITASLSVSPPTKVNREQLASTSLYRLVNPMVLKDYTSLSLRERILVGNTMAANLEVTSLIIPLPKVVTT